MADATASPLGVAAGSGWNSAPWGTTPWNDSGIGTVTVVFTSSETVIATNVSATGSVGSVVVGPDQIVVISGVEGPTVLGTVSISYGAIDVPVIGVAAGSSWGSGPWGTGPWNDNGIGIVIIDIVNGSNTAIVTGVEATGSIGTVIGSTVPYTYANPTGVEASGQTGSVTVVPNSIITLTGVSATGGIGIVSTLANSQWFAVNDNQTPNWVPVNDSQIN
jgi:hypothetical protein